MHSDKSRLLATREQQDAQEFLMFLLDALDRESTRQWVKIHSPPGLESLTSSSSPASIDAGTLSTVTGTTTSPFEGLSAHRMGCLKCKFVENIRLEKFGPMVLPITTMGKRTTLQDVLTEEFKMETLDDVECVKCTLLAYRTGLARVVAVLGNTTPQGHEATTRLSAIDKVLSSDGKIGDPTLLLPQGTEESIKKFMKRSHKTKHSMIARAPRVLAFHIQRSNYLGRAMKNQASVEFPEELDVSRYVTTTRLSMDPEEPISEWEEGDGRTVYRLRSVIVHYGLHHMGHYVAYRRHGEKWFRISDEDVEYTPLTL
jgi:ubiquitin carboxyl-terminal hydrolase 1